MLVGALGALGYINSTAIGTKNKMPLTSVGLKEMEKAFHHSENQFTITEACTYPGSVIALRLPSSIRNFVDQHIGTLVQRNRSA
jgi:hypothetical protein